MANSEKSSILSLPPPPPPPPMESAIFTFTSPKLQIQCPVTEFINKEDMENEIREKISKELDENRDNNVTSIVFMTPIQPILQNGPMCGLVALEMAAQLYSPSKPSLNFIFETAKIQNFTKSGEMFCIQEMKNLAQITLNCEAQILNTEFVETLENVLMCILNGDLILVPYDADYNNTPALRHGHAAHWSLLIGCAVSLPHGHALISQLTNFPQNSLNGEHKMIFCDPKTLNDENRKEILKFLISMSPSQILVCGRQGKSKKIGLWTYQSLIDSNQNLREIGRKIKEKLEEFILHPLERTLRSQLILLGRNVH